MKSALQNYKQYPVPVRIIIAYVIISVAGIVLLDLFATLMIALGATEGFFGSLLSALVTIIVFAVGILILATVQNAFCCGKKIYRGIGLYYLLTVATVLCPIAFILMIVVLCLSGEGITFFGVVTLLLECAVPACMNFFLRTTLRRCDNCGLIKTFNYVSTKTQSLGVKEKYHTEGGYYQDVKTKGKVSEISLTPEVFEVEISTKQYVPKTTVRDGRFETTRSTSRYACAVCGNISVDTIQKETKIGD